MKRIGKPVAVIIAVLCVAIFCLSTVGISTQYGDVVSKKVLGINSTAGGLGIAFDATSSVKTDSEVSEETMKEAVSCMEQRLALLAITDYTLAADAASKSVVLTSAYDSGSSYSPAQVANFLATTGKFTIRIGAEKDEDGKMTGITAEDSSILLTSADVKKVYTNYNYSNGTYQYYITIQLKNGAATRYANAVQALINAADYEQISWWIDDNTMFCTQALDTITDTSIITITNDEWTSANASIYALYMQCDPLPVSFTFATNNVAQQPALGKGTLKALTISGALALIGIIVFLTVKYGMFGISTGVTTIGAVGCLFALYSGFVKNTNSNVYMTVFSIAVLAAVVLLMAERTIRSARKASAELDEGSSLTKSVADATTDDALNALKTVGAIAVGGLLVLWGFAKKANFITKIVSLLSGGTVISTVTGCGLAIFVSAIVYYLFGVLLNGVLVRSFASFDSLGDRKWFGGKVNG